MPPALFTQQHPSAVTIHQSRLAHQPLSLSLYLEWLERSNSLLATPRQEGSDSSHRSQDRELINGWSVTETGGVGGWGVGGGCKVSGSTEAEWNAKSNCTLPLRWKKKITWWPRNSPARHYTPYYIILDSNTDTAVCCILKIPVFLKKKTALHTTLFDKL